MSYIPITKYPELPTNVKKYIKENRKKNNTLKKLYEEGIRRENMKKVEKSIEEIFKKW